MIAAAPARTHARGRVSDDPEQGRNEDAVSVLAVHTCRSAMQSADRGGASGAVNLYASGGGAPAPG